VILYLVAAALLTLGEDGASSIGRAQAALEADRPEEARALFEEALRQEESYAALVGLGVALARTGHEDAAAERLTRAIAVNAGRPEAWVERGGLRFTQRRYRDAIRDLDAGLDRRDEPYTRDFLATALFLSGRQDEALAQWNRQGRPPLRLIHLSGLEFTQGALVRGEIPLKEGALLDLGGLRAARLRLGELGVFDRTTLRPVPLADGAFDLDVAVMDRRGFARSPVELGLVTAVNLASSVVQMRYANLLGRGFGIAGRYRFQEHRPEISLAVDWPRPLGLAGKLRLKSSRGRQRYSLDDEFDRTSRSVELAYRRVVGSRTIVEVGPRVLWRSFSRPVSLAFPGAVAGVELGLERRLIETYRQKLDLRIDCWAGLPRSGGRYARARGILAHKLALGPDSEGALDRSVLALRGEWGGTTRETPVDEWFAPGASPDMELPLRAHPQTRSGILGVTPLTPGLVLLNVEWRQRLVKKPFGEVGLVGFYDGAWLSAGAKVGSGTVVRRAYHDVGLGVRVRLAGATVIRLDWGHGLEDSSRSLTVGLGETF
jgi:hypothetical protein